LVAGALVLATLDGDSGLRSWVRLRSDLREVDARLQSLRAQVESLRAQAAALEGDDFAIERAIREDLEYARRGETVVRLLRSDGPSPRFP
jgi:cell division protein FtsB